jgi:tungstate transport system substrate-binding protein
MRRLLSIIAVLSFALGACGSAAPTAAPVGAPTGAPTAQASAASSDAAPAPAGSRNLILATTTSTQDSGLLDVLVPDFEAKTGYVVKVVAVGSGAALKLGQEGNADVLLVHSPADEQALMDTGFGVDRRLIMHNDFIIVGPAADLAAIKGTSAVDAFTKVAAAKAGFVSRGDKSGTNTKELGLWKKAGITPEGDWYVESGQGMGATLKIASEKGAYTLTDRATYLAQKATLALDILVEGDASLLNVYHVISVNPAKWPKVNTAGATAFADYLVSPGTQTLIGQFGVDKYGQQLFIPDAGKDESTLGK